jgi:uncharacterized protein (TIGR03435 family)
MLIAFGLVAQQQNAPAPAFDVISIKPDTSGSMGMRLNIAPGGTFRADGVPLKLLMQEAYDVKESQIIGAPAWFNTDKYNIEAKSDEATAAEMKNLDPGKRKDKMMLMIRSLLMERCKMTVHQETKEMSILSMVVAKNGSKLKASAPPDMSAGDPATAPGAGPGPNGPRQGVRMGRGEVKGNAVSLSLLANILSRQLGRTVVDNTGLTGVYDFDLKWTPDENEGQMFRAPGGDAAATPPPVQTAGPTVFTAIQEQLGLKLEATKAPVAVWMIDHVEKPTAN